MALFTKAFSRCLPLAAAAIVLCVPLAAQASESWPGIRAEVYGGKTLHDGRGIVTLKAPYRPDNVRAVPLEAAAHLTDGRTIKSMAFIVDENPSPVAAMFRLGGATRSRRHHDQYPPQPAVRRAHRRRGFRRRALRGRAAVKFAGGQASCSAPPMGDPAEIAANMGKMDFAAVGEKATASHARSGARFALNHPNHTGMVLDQITLLYVPLLMVDRIEARQGDEMVFEMTGSITLAQNPQVEFDYVTNGAAEMTMAARDTSGATWQRQFPIGPAG